MAKTKPKIEIGIRKPPKERDTEAFIRGEVASEPGPQSEENPKRVSKPKVSREVKEVKGKGIVERADGTKKRRLVVYVQPEHGRKLKAIAALKGLDMSELVDNLLAGWLEEVDVSL